MYVADLWQEVGLEVEADFEKFVRGFESWLALVAIRVAANLISLLLGLVRRVDDVVCWHDFPSGNDARHGLEYVNHHWVWLHVICNLLSNIIRVTCSP
jgi:hypothetical protein